MIVFLTLVYVGLLFLLVKLKVIKLTNFWKASPVLWFLALNVLLFIPMQWGAPSGTANVYQNVIEIIPNVSGEVVEVNIQGLTKLKKGDTLFKIDPAPFEAEVERLKAALAAAEQTVPQMKAVLDETTASLAGSKARYEDAKSEFDRDKKLVGKGVITQEEFEQAERNLSMAQASVDQAQARKLKADLEYHSEVNGEHTSVAQIRAQLKQAELNLGWTTVKAPADGYVVGASLRPGQRVTNMPLRGWMAFVATDKSSVAVGIPQYTMRHIKIGDEAEVTFKLHPGKTFQAEVQAIGLMTPEGQWQPSGVIAPAPTNNTDAAPYGVILRLLPEDGEELPELPGGAVGTAAVYTDTMKLTHIIRKVMVRMQGYMNYVLP